MKSIAVSAVLVSALIAVVVQGAGPNTPVWTHDWDTVGSQFAAHGNRNTTLEGLTFLAKNFVIVTFGNCFNTLGEHHNDVGGTMESEVLKAAKYMKTINPKLKVIFYWKSDDSEELVTCSSANSTWQAHPEWQLMGDDGKPIKTGRGVYYDTSNPEFRDFWVGHIMNLTAATWNSMPLIDGAFADGGWRADAPFSGISKKRGEQWENDKAIMVGQLQDAFDARGLGKQVVLANSVDSVDGLNADMGRSGGQMTDHFGIIQFIDKKTGEWIPEAMEDLLFNVVATDANANRTVEVKGWPGPLIDPKTWWNNSQPTTTEGLTLMMQNQFNPALALYLLVARPSTFWLYSWFWDMATVIPVSCDGDITVVPKDFYPELKCKLGEPTGKATPVPGKSFAYTRDFPGASVFVDLTNRTSARVTWKTESGCVSLNK